LTAKSIGHHLEVKLIDEEDMNESNVAQGVHRLVLLHGRDRAREMVDTKNRLLVDIAAEVLADDSQKIGISYTGFCLTSLPHKKLPEDQTWEKKGYRVTLWVEPGRMKVGGRVTAYGVPYGARARMILLYLQTQAVRIGSREVELGRSMRDWMERMGLAIGGETARSLREQAARISACTLKFFWEEEEKEGWARGAIVSSGLRFKIPEVQQGSLWDDRVVLDEMFWTALRSHPVPLLEAAIRQLRDRSMSLDIYIWLAWRLHQLDKSTPISWSAIHSQFGAGFKAVKHFKPAFTEALAAAVAAYPEARVAVSETGITLHPSRPPISRLPEGPPTQLGRLQSVG
jgi:hypothetical protein